MRQDILKIISMSKNVTHIIVLTHNIDFFFLQGFVIPILRKCGYPSLTIFADGDSCSNSFQRQGQWIDGIGKRYRVVPVFMEPGFCFHPKAIMLSSEDKATLLVGSGNLGFGGWRENAEVWIHFDTDVDGELPFSSFRKLLSRILKLVPFNEPIVAEIDEAFDTKIRKWAVNLGDSGLLVGKCKEGPALIEKIFQIIEDEDIKKLIVCTPYFDTKGKMLQKLSKHLNDLEMQVFIQKGKSNLLKKAADNLPSNVSIQLVDFIREGNLNSFLHAKFYAFEGSNSIIVFVGSANCSIAALGIPGRGGNAEFMCLQNISKEEFNKNFLQELKFMKGDPQLKEIGEEDIKKVKDDAIRILAARYNQGELEIGYSCKKDIKINSCLIDGNPVKFEIIENGKILVHLERLPHRVLLIGIKGKETIRSPVSWIDHEFDLSSSSKQRAVANSINRKVRSNAWGISSFAEILKLVYYNMKYIPDKKYISKRILKRNKDNEEVKYYTEEDIFTDHYGLPRVVNFTYSINEIERINGLRNMLLRWFGIGWGSEEDFNETAIEDNLERKREGEALEYQREIISSKNEKQIKSETTESKSRNIKNLIRKIANIMISPGYLETRPLELLKIDLAIISILIQTSLVEGWINIEDFLAFTHQIWSILFFPSNINGTRWKTFSGFLQYMYDNSDNPEDFKQELTCIDMSAALASWALAVPKDIHSPEKALFSLACATSIARFPWLWYAYSPNKIGATLQKYLIYTGIIKTDSKELWDVYRRRWLELIRRGFSLKKLEQLLSKLSLGKCRKEINRMEVKKGEILWQGKVGLCISGEDCVRSEERNVDVLCLQGKERYRKFKSDYLVPLDALLSTKKISLYKKLNKIEKNILNNFINELTEDFENVDIKSI